jgi:drug/metabolite transporter (DMT)-like permease
MQWLGVSIFAYFLIAFQSSMDKFLLSSRRISHPAVYAFYSGFLSLFAFILFPFGFHLVETREAMVQIFSGAVFAYGVLFLFFAIRDNEATQVVPVVGAVTSAATYFFSFVILEEQLSRNEIMGIATLILGGLLISFDFSRKSRRKIFLGFEFSLLAGVLLAVSYTMFKVFFGKDNFVNVYIWTRFGLFAGALSFLLYAPWRKKIRSSFANFKKPREKNRNSGLIFVLNKIMGGVGSFLLNYGISLGSVTVVNALVSLEYLFIFILAWIFSLWFRDIFREKRDLFTLSQRIAAGLIITGGMILVSK